MKKKILGFPFAGGGPSSFNMLKETISDEIEIIGVPFPGREKLIANPTIDEIHELSEYCSNYIKKNILDTNISFLGHCFGGRVAFETAKLLENSGIGVENIFLSSTPAPNTEGSKLAYLNDEDLLERITYLTNYETPSWQYKELRVLQIPSLRADILANENYFLQPVEEEKIKQNLIIIDAKDDTFISSSETSPWKSFGLNVKNYLVEGEHMYLLTKQGSKQLSELIEYEMGVKN